MTTEKTGTTASLPWSVPVAVEEIPDTGLHIEIDAPEAARAELAALAAVRDLPKLKAVFDVTRQGAKIHVAGQVIAKVEQTCVVTLEPLESEVAEAVDLTFVPPSTDGMPAAEEVEVKVDKEPPEPLVGGTVDLGAVATEFLVLGIDPYPRKPGAEFIPPKVESTEANPFAALAALKKPPGGSQS